VRIGWNEKFSRRVDAIETTKDRSWRVGAVKALSSLLPSALPRPDNVVGWNGIIIIARLGLILVVDDAVSVQGALEHGSFACDTTPSAQYSRKITCTFRFGLPDNN
jgi:hypothetical protein